MNVLPVSYKHTFSKQVLTVIYVDCKFLSTYRLSYFRDYRKLNGIYCFIITIDVRVNFNKAAFM